VEVRIIMKPTGLLERADDLNRGALHRRSIAKAKLDDACLTPEERRDAQLRREVDRQQARRWRTR
jgi:hypothetical protein